MLTIKERGCDEEKEEEKRGRDNHLNRSSSASHLICSSEDLITSNSLLISFAYFAAIK